MAQHWHPIKKKGRYASDARCTVLNPEIVMFGRRTTERSRRALLPSLSQVFPTIHLLLNLSINKQPHLFKLVMYLTYTESFYMDSWRLEQ